MYVRVHFAKTQVQLPLDQIGEGRRLRGMERFVEGVVAK